MTVGISTDRKNGGWIEDGLHHKLKRLGVLKNKHIPLLYKANSRAIRMSLLAGLADSEGYINKKSKILVYVSKLRVLAYDVAFLARSLGYFARITKIKKGIDNAAYNTKHGFPFVGEYYQVSISGDFSDMPTILERKKVGPRLQKKNVLVSTISVSPCGLGEYYGFEIDKDGLFILEDFTVTHNSTSMLNAVIDHANHNMPVLLVSLENDLYFTVQRILEIKYKKPYSEFTHEDWSTIRSDMIDYPLYIDVSMETFTFERISKVIHQAKRLYGIDFFAFDHIGFLPTRDDPREISQMIRGLKLLAREHDIIIYIISHVRKMKDDNEYATIEDIKSSSSIAQDSDIVLFIYDTKAGVEINIDKARMSQSKLRVPILFNGVSGVMEDDYSRNVKRYDEEILDPVV